MEMKLLMAEQKELKHFVAQTLEDWAKECNLRGKGNDGIGKNKKQNIWPENEKLREKRQKNS